MRLDVLDSALNAGLPTFGPSEPQLLQMLRRAQVAYLRASLDRTDLPITVDQTQTLRRHAAYLDLHAEAAGPSLGSDAWYVAGTIYEWMSRLAPIEAIHSDAPGLTRGRVGDLVRASLAYSSGLHEGSSTAAARRALDAFRLLPDTPPIVKATGTMILALLARDFAAVVEAAVPYGEAVQGSLEPRPDPDEPWPSLGVLGRAAEAAASLAGAMLSGSEELFADSRARFVDARRVAAAAADDVAAVVDRLARVSDGISQRSTYRILATAGLPLDLVRAFAVTRPELWSNQVDAIEAGLLNPDRAFVLSLPTGSGKTFLAQLRVLATLERHPESWTAYVAPSRALVREAHADLAAALRPHNVRVQKVVAGAEAGTLLDEDEVPAVTGARTCAVLTPERLDLYLRTNPDVAATLRLVIVDEAHHIGDQRRGATLETLISLLRARWPEAKPVLLSAFMPNAEEVKAWLGDDADLHASRARPTRQLRGILLRHDQEALPPTWTYGAGQAEIERRTRTQGWKKHRTDRRRYSVGALVTMTGTTPTQTPGAAAFAVPGLAQGLTWRERSAPRRGRPAPAAKSGGTGVTDVAVQAAVALAAHPGLVLVFMKPVDSVQKAAVRIAEQLPIREVFEPYAVGVERILGLGHPLAAALRHGCAYHHSQMPDDVARIVEAAAQVPLDVLCSTSGLQAGVNLPAAVVLSVGDWTAPVGTDPTPRNYANMAGRAGRPGHETEGLALFLPGSITYGDPLGAARGYLNPTDAEVAVVSALSELLAGLIDLPETTALDDLPDRVQQMLLALWAADMRDARSVGTFLERTFRGPDLPHGLGQDLATVVGSAGETGGARFTAFSRTALPYGAYVSMSDLVPTLLEHLEDGDWRGSVARQAVSVTRLLLRVPYFSAAAAGRLGNDFSVEAVAAMIEAWIRGGGYSELARALGLNPDRLSRTVRAVNELSSYLAWGAGSLLSLASAEERQEGFQPLLPYYIRFGVNSPVAAYLRLLGISDRTGALAIGERYPVDQGQDYAAVEAWTRSFAGRAVIRDYYANDVMTHSNIERDLGLEETPRLRLSYFAALGTHPDWIRPGTVLEVTGAGDEWTARDAVSRVSWSVENVPDRGTAIVLGRVDGRLRGILLSRA